MEGLDVFFSDLYCIVFSQHKRCLNEPRAAKLLTTSTSSSRSSNFAKNFTWRLNGSEIEISPSSYNSKFCSLLFIADTDKIVENTIRQVQLFTVQTEKIKRD